jgi:hypothetical protein
MQEKPLTAATQISGLSDKASGLLPRGKPASSAQIEQRMRARESLTWLAQRTKSVSANLLSSPKFGMMYSCWNGMS